MRRILPLLIAIPLILAVGVAEGIWTHRWGKPEQLKQAVARLSNNVPKTVGKWKGTDQKSDPRQIEVAEVDGILFREYVHPTKKHKLYVMIACGRPGPVSLHPPDVCYPGIGYDLTSPPTQEVVKVGSQIPPAHFKLGDFKRSSSAAYDGLRIRWAWSTQGAWQSPDNPRWEYGFEPVLYKMYVIRQVLTPDEPPEEDPVPEFLQEFLPLLDRALFPK